MLERLLVVAALALTAVTLTPVAAGASLLAPATCAEVKAGNPSATDGTFSIFPAGPLGPLLSVFCHDMAGTPTEFLSLAHTESGHNFAQYTAGGASPGTSVVTRYTKIRFDPIPIKLLPLTFRVNIADQTFTMSSGQLCHSHQLAGCPAGQLVNSMPYAVAMDCIGSGSHAGLGNLDLRGTLFNVVNTFTVQSFLGTGSATFSTPQLVDLTGGGFCGWIAPATTFNPINTNPLSDANGGFDLQITLLL
jgi:hypothetical protein